MDTRGVPCSHWWPKRGRAKGKTMFCKDGRMPLTAHSPDSGHWEPRETGTDQHWCHTAKDP